MISDSVCFILEQPLKQQSWALVSPILSELGNGNCMLSDIQCPHHFFWEVDSEKLGIVYWQSLTFIVGGKNPLGSIVSHSLETHNYLGVELTVELQILHICINNLWPV